MPITKSAKKSLKVSRTRQSQNEKCEILLSKALKKVDEKNISEVVSIIDKAAKIGIIAKNKASRLKSGLMKKYGNGENQKSKLKTQNEKVKLKKKKTSKAVTKETVK